MSLNGLDDPKVIAAYQSALAEAGGWFLLRYVSRDEVDVFKSGKGGLTEARSAVAEYEKKSPLYGFLLYRRRKVLIKYIPDGTSRLLQARVTVHFQSITDKFSPHDTIFPISAPEDLNEITLTAACALHTASISTSPTSPSTPAKRKKLSGITEYEEEVEEKAFESVSPVREVPSTPVQQLALPVLREASADAKFETKDRRPQTPVLISLPSITRTDTSDTKFSQDTVQTSPKGKENLDLSATASLPAEFAQSSRSSTSTLRPNPDDLSSISPYIYKPKVKLGPRPRTSIDSEKRPKTAGARPISTLPAGLKVSRRNNPGTRPKTRDSETPSIATLSPPPPIPANPTTSPILSPPAGRAHSVKSLPAIVHRAARSPGLSMEKQRLMKAVELRKRQMKAQEEREAAEAARSAAAPAEAIGTNEEPQEISQTPRNGVSEPAAAMSETLNPKENPLPVTPQRNPKEADLISRRDNTSVSALVDAQVKPTANSTVSAQHSRNSSETDVTGDTHEPDEEHSSIMAASSPTSVQESSITDQSTRPSSIAEEDLLPSTVYVPPPPKSASRLIFDESDNVSEPEQANSIRESLDSTPTVVPEDSSPVQSDQPILDQQPFQSTQPSIPTFRQTTYSSTGEERESMINQTTYSPGGTPRNSSHDLRINTDFRRREKRRALLDPSHANPSAENSDAEYLSDDDFMEELESATLQHARPLTVSKSPITPFFPNARKGSAATITLLNGRPTSSAASEDRPVPRRTGSGVGVLEMARSFSGGSPDQPPSPENIALAKKTGVSSGISQRIRALAEKTTRDPTTSVPGGSSRPGSPAGDQEWRRTHLRTPPKNLSAAHTTWHQRESVASMESLASKELYAPKSQFIQPSQENLRATVYNVRQEPSRPETVSVTARIIRDDRTKNPILSAPNEHTPLELHQSPLIIDHQQAKPVLVMPHLNSKTILAPLSPIEDKLPSPSSTAPSRESSSNNLPRNSIESSWRNFGSKRRGSSTKSPPPLERNYSASSLNDIEDESKDKDRKKSRTSRLMKRMSTSLTGGARKTPAQAATPVLKEAEASRALAPLREPPPAMRIGDVNIQFPDTLLWKRRFMEIDGHGNIVLTVSKANDDLRGVTKRYHLTEFRAPYAPDLDRQELPNSVMLDFLDGSTLQVACESYMTQVQVLQILKEAHQAWLTFNEQ